MCVLALSLCVCLHSLCVCACGHQGEVGYMNSSHRHRSGQNVLPCHFPVPPVASEVGRKGTDVVQHAPTSTRHPHITLTSYISQVTPYSLPHLMPPTHHTHITTTPHTPLTPHTTHHILAPLTPHTTSSHTPIPSHHILTHPSPLTPHTAHLT